MVSRVILMGLVPIPLTFHVSLAMSLDLELGWLPHTIELALSSAQDGLGIWWLSTSSPWNEIMSLENYQQRIGQFKVDTMAIEDDDLEPEKYDKDAIADNNVEPEKDGEDAIEDNDAGIEKCNNDVEPEKDGEDSTEDNDADLEKCNNEEETEVIFKGTVDDEVFFKEVEVPKVFFKEVMEDRQVRPQKEKKKKKIQIF